MQLNRTKMAAHLAQAERQVAKWHALVERQTLLVEKLKRAGLETESSVKVLIQYEASLSIYLEDRDRFRHALAKSKKA
jgi:hypothetical protein